MSPLLIGAGLAILFVIFLLFQAVKILPEYERGVVFRLGRARIRAPVEGSFYDL